MMKHATLDSICNTIDCTMGVGLPGGTGVSVALRVDDVLSPEPLVRKSGTQEFRAYPWGNPGLRESLAKFRPWNPRLADAVTAVLNVRDDESLKGVRKVLEPFRNESLVCRLALAKCYLKGRDGTIDRGRALGLLSKDGRNDSVDDMERACRKTVFSADDLLNEIGVYHYGTGKAKRHRSFSSVPWNLTRSAGTMSITIAWRWSLWGGILPLSFICVNGASRVTRNFIIIWATLTIITTCTGMARCTNLCRTASRAWPKMWPRRPSGCPRAETSGVIRCCRRYISTITGIRTKGGISKKEAMGFSMQGRHSRFACRGAKAATVIPWLVWETFMLMGMDVKQAMTKR